VITEAAWLLRQYPHAIRKLLASLHGRPFELVPLGETDLPGIAAVLAKYEGLRIQLVEIMFTLDRRDFGVLRMAHGKKLRLIP
jgi:hypothetical protein